MVSIEKVSGRGDGNRQNWFSGLSGGAPTVDCRKNASLEMA